jgi:hypothetical protein
MLLHIFWLADHGHLDQVADFHTEDAVVTSNIGHHMEGREAIRADGIKEALPPGVITRHVMTALQFAPNRDGSVQTTCSVLRFSRTDDQPGICLLEDSAATLVRVEGSRWLISKRHVDVLFPIAPVAGLPGGGRPSGPPARSAPEKAPGASSGR